jgi:hypothetical protein
VPRLADHSGGAERVHHNFSLVSPWIDSQRQLLHKSTAHRRIDESFLLRFTIFKNYLSTTADTIYLTLSLGALQLHSKLLKQPLHQHGGNARHSYGSQIVDRNSSLEEIPQLPSRYQIDSYRAHITELLHEVTGVDSLIIYPALQWTQTLDKGDLVLPVPALRVKGKKPPELAAEWVEKVCLCNCKQ